MTLRRLHSLLFALAFSGVSLHAQQALTVQEAQQLYRDIPGLMEATAIVVLVGLWKRAVAALPAGRGTEVVCADD